MTTISNVQRVDFSPNFKARETRLIRTEKYPDYEVKTYETEASSGKKWGVGLASAFCSGLGQAINGDWGKAAGFFFGNMGLGALAGFTFFRSPALCAIASLGALGTKIWTIVDAVKSAKSETTQIVPNDTKEKSVDIAA